MKTTMLSVLVLALLASCTATRAQEISRTNATPAPLLLAKASPHLQPEILGTKMLSTAFDKSDLRLSLQATGKKEVKQDEPIFAHPPSPALIRLEKDPFPNLYYVHMEDSPGNRGVSQDDVGRIWKLSPRTTLLFPFGRWDNPGIHERITLGFCLRFKLK